MLFWNEISRLIQHNLSFIETLRDKKKIYSTTKYVLTLYISLLQETNSTSVTNVNYRLDIQTH